jgi:Holliday junction resolvase RusA-like endonuclease
MEILFQAYFKVMRHAASKNEKTIRKNFKTGNRFIGKKDNAISSEEWIKRYLIREKIMQRIDTITCDLNLEVHFFFPQTVYFTKKGHRNQKITDLSNAYEIIQDCLQKTKVIKDDTQICSHDGSRRHPIEGNEYFVRIILTEFKEVVL